MKQRKIFVKGMEAAPEEPPQIKWLGDHTEYNYKVNQLRQGSTSIRHGSDTWPIIDRHLGPDVSYLRIEPDKKPDGCSEVWYAETSQKAFNTDKVWFVCIRTFSRALLDMFIRVPFDEVKFLPMEYASIVSMNVRPLKKVRFSGHSYFIPEPGFCYVGNAYR